MADQFINFKKKIIDNRHTLGRTERLKSRKLIEQVFRDGKSITAFPLRLSYTQVDTALAPLQAGFSASSRNFKKATDRNRIKRLLREAYRRQKTDLLQHMSDSGGHLVIFIIYTGKELPSYAVVDEQMKQLINKLIARLSGLPQ